MESGGDEPALRVCEPEAEERAAAGRLLGGDAAAVRLRHLAHDRETEARARQRARRGRAIEAVEHVYAVVRRDAGAVVAHAQLAVRERDVDRRTFRAPLACVLEQVPHCAFEPLGHAGYHARRELGIELDLREAAARALDRVLDKMVELHGALLLGGIAAGELEETGDQVAHLVRLAFEVGEELVALARLQPLLLLENLDVRLKAREGRPELVRRVRDEAALRLDRLL